MESGKPKDGNVQVMCRIRPMNSKEKGGDKACCVFVNKDKQSVSINTDKNINAAFGVNQFQFDRVFGMETD